jgi:mono/diheme cytochrome c family protein
MSRHGWMELLVSALMVGILGIAGCTGKKPAPANAPASGSVEAGAAAATAVSLTKDVMPLFARSCGVCHRREGGNEEAVEDGTYYETIADILGNVGTHITAGDPAASGLLKVCNQSRPVSDEKIVMPPPESGVQKWSTDELAKLSAWIEQGAQDN